MQRPIVPRFETLENRLFLTATSPTFGRGNELSNGAEHVVNLKKFVYVAGYSSGTTKFGNGFQLEGEGNDTYPWVCKFRKSDRTCVAARKLGTNISADRVAGLVVDPAADGNVIAVVAEGNDTRIYGLGKKKLATKHKKKCKNVQGEKARKKRFKELDDSFAQQQQQQKKDNPTALLTESVLILTGSFFGEADFGSTVRGNEFDSTPHGFIAAFALDDFQDIWVNTYGEGTPNSVRVTGIDINEQTNQIVASANFGGEVDFDPDPNDERNLDAGTGTDSAIFTLTEDGELGDWIRHVDSTGTGFGSGSSVVDVEFDDDGNVAATGSFYNETSVGSLSRTSNGERDVLFLKLRGTTGKPIFFNSFGGAGAPDIALGIEEGNSFHIFGVFSQTVDFNPGSGTHNESAVNGANAFLAEFASGGKFDSVQTIEETSGGFDFTEIRAASFLGNSYAVVGQFSGSSIFPFGKEKELTSKGDNDIFIYIGAY